MSFEVRSWDGAGRLGELEVPRAGVTVETPALLPVVNPHVQAIEPARLGEEFGAEMLITNAYVLWGSDDLREDVEERGVHDLLGFDGAVMTDSGSFQLAEYGDIDVDTREILEFQRTIGSDVATPVDVPTPPDVGRERAAEELATTQKRLETAADFDAGEMLVNAPIQGSTHPDLRREAAEHAAATGLDVFPVGAVVPLMNAYRYGDVAEVVGAARRGLPLSAPVHLFGAGHPMMFALAVALGCDLFDSAAYALYANDDRYLTVRGTRHLDDLEYLPCECPVCAGHGADGLAALSSSERRDRLAEHNLHVSFGELRRVKQAVREGDLLELVETRARGHPTMLDGYRAALADADRLEATDPASKGTFFYVSGESATRPEVARHHDRLGRLSPPEDLLLAPPDAPAPAGDHDATWRLDPPFGPVPPALTETYPLTAELPDRVDDGARAAAVEGVRALADAHPDTAVTVAHEGWPGHLLAALPDEVDAVDVSG
jgi:7-cyano-7-deazaguanine tRNA-ribosyltransferase